MKYFKNLKPWQLFLGIAVAVLIATVASPYVVDLIAESTSGTTAMIAL